MKSSGSQGQSKGVNSSGGGGMAYGQPYIQNGGNEGANPANRVATNSNLKSYITELKKASSANKSGGKRGHSSTRQGASGAGTTQVLRQQQQQVVNTYSGNAGMPQTTKNTSGGGPAQFAFEYQVPNGGQNQQKQQRNGANQAQLSELAIKDNVTGALTASNNLTQLVSPSNTFGRTGSRQGNSYSRAVSNGQIAQSQQNQQFQVLSPAAVPQGTNSQFGPLAAAANTSNNRSGQQQQQFLAGFISPQGANQMLNQTQQVFTSSSKINASNASSKAFQYLQKKGNLHSNAVSSNQNSGVNNQDLGQGDRSSSHLIKRINSGRKQLSQAPDPNSHAKRQNRKSNTRAGVRNQSQNYNQSASQALLNNPNMQSQQFPGQVNMSQGHINQSKAQQQQQLVKQATNDNRLQKDVIIRKNSSKSLLPQQNPSGGMPNISNIKSQDGAGSNKRGTSQGHVNKKAAGVLLLNTESMDRETANTSKLGNNATTGSNHKRMTSNPNNYVKVQNSEVSSAGTADAMFQGGLPSTNNYTTAGQNTRVPPGGMPHTLGNTLGNNQKQSLNMSNYGGYFSAIQRDSSLNENNTLGKNGINLGSLIRQNLLEEDGIEDLHFYFVSFQQHKKQILMHQKKRQEIRAREKTKQQIEFNSGAETNSNGPRMVVPKIQMMNSGVGRKGINAVSSNAGSTRQMLVSTTSPASKGECETAQNKTIESCDDEEFV